METKIRSSKNSTLRILNREGNKRVTRAQMEANSMGYFRELFYSPTNTPTPIPITFPRIVSKEMNGWLTQPLEEEIRATLYSFNSTKFPGSGGFTSKSEFFKKLWPGLKDITMQCVHQFLKESSYSRLPTTSLSHSSPKPSQLQNWLISGSFHMPTSSTN